MQDEYDFTEAQRGAVVPGAPDTTAVTLRLDDDVLDWFRAAVNDAGGGSYHTLINRVLRDHIKRRQEPLEDTLRRVVREELHREELSSAV